MSDDLSDEDPFADDQKEVEEKKQEAAKVEADVREKAIKENLITDPMVKKATFLIHKLANQKKQDYKDIQKKCRSLFKYENLAKVSLEDGHKIIDKLIELTGGEEGGARVTDDGSKHKEIEKRPAEKEEEVINAEDDPATATMRNSVRAAVDITLKEVVAKDVPVQGLGGFVFEISKVIFEAKMSEEAD